MRGTRAEKITLYNAKKPSNISARLIQSPSKTQTPFPKSDRRERTHGADEKDEGAAVRSSTSAAEMKQSCQIRYSAAERPGSPHALVWLVLLSGKRE